MGLAQTHGQVPIVHLADRSLGMARGCVSASMEGADWRAQMGSDTGYEPGHDGAYRGIQGHTGAYSMEIQQSAA